MSKLPNPLKSFNQLTNDIEEYGYCVLPQALEPPELTTIERRLVSQANSELFQGVSYTNPGHENNQWVNMLLNKGPEFETLVLHPQTTRIIKFLLGDDYLISCVDAQIKHPGDPAMPLHTDQWWMPKPVYPSQRTLPPGSIKRNRVGVKALKPTSPMIAPVVTANIMWMISDFTEENGATVLVPKSHLSGAQPDGSLPHPVETVQAVGKKGTALIFDGRLWHAAGENFSQKVRYGITCTFCGPQFRQLENYTRGLRPEVLARASPLLLQRLGFKAWSTYGHTGDPDLDVSSPGTSALGPLGDC